MYTIFDTSSVPVNVITPDPMASPADNAGLIHNYYLFQINKLLYSIGYSPALEFIGLRISRIAQDAETTSPVEFPAGSAAIITTGISDFLSTNDMNSAIKVWKDLFDTYKIAPTYVGTGFVAVLSVAYYSGEYWSNIVYTIPNTTSVSECNPTIHPTVPGPVKFMKRWKKILLADIIGAFDGGFGGSLLGPIGAAAGAAVIGFCASELEAGESE